jgi:hypothetical protein
MSEHEYQDLIEMSIKLLAQSQNTLHQNIQCQTRQLDLRDVFHTLYQFQNLFDAGKTYFRVMAILLKYRMFYQLEPEDYAEVELLQKRQLLSEDLFEAIYQDQDQFGLESENSVVAYWFFNPELNQTLRASGALKRWKLPRIFVPANSSLIPVLVERGVLPASEAVPPKQLPFEQVAALVARAAEVHGETRLISYWYVLLPKALLSTNKAAYFQTIKTNPYLLELLKIVERTGVRTMTAKYGAWCSPESNDLLEFDDQTKTMFFSWWFER